MDAVYAELSEEPRLTLFQALFEIVRRTGYVSNKADFGRLLQVNQGNLYSYLAPMDRPHRLRMEPGLVHALCWQIARTTGLRVRLLLDPDPAVELEVSGTDAHGAPVRPTRFRTTYHIPWEGVRPNEPWTCDFQAPAPLLPQWEEEWELDDASHVAVEAHSEA